MTNKVRLLAIALVALLALVAVASPAKADTTYTYTGNQFDTFYPGFGCPSLCSVAGSFSTATALGDSLNLAIITPDDYVFFDGVDASAPAQKLREIAPGYPVFRVAPRG